MPLITGGSNSDVRALIEGLSRSASFAIFGCLGRCADTGK
jgi:hypothetical protein